ncbi:UNVERIFIED_CONTAM: hypothetical protein BEN50_18790 [Euhalothece sp. KZN 001]
MKTGAGAPDKTPLPTWPRGVGDCRGPYGKAFAPLSATAPPAPEPPAGNENCGNGAVAGGNRSAGRSRAVSPGVGAVERADRAAGCGALGCRETQRLWRVTVAGQQRVLCAVHAVRWLLREGAALRILPMPTLPPRRCRNQRPQAPERGFRVKI